MMKMQDDKMSFVFFLMGSCVFLQASYLALLFIMTTHFILKAHQASLLVSQLNTLPLSTIQILSYLLLGFVLLLVVMKYRSKVKENPINMMMILLLELIFCSLMMKSIYFTSNSVVLFAMMNMLSITRKKGYKGFSLVIFIVFYLFSNYDIISSMISIPEIQTYLNFYTRSTQTLFLGINNIFTSVNIILFITFMILLIQEQYNESKKIQLLNDELNELNIQLKEYADVREKMGETKERNRLAREIHDTLGHTLTGLSTGLDACKTLMDVDVNLAKKQAELLSKVAKEGLNDVRRSVKKLRPDALEKNTLQEALENMIQEFVSTTQVTIHFVCHLKALIFQADEEDTIYRIIQESITNAIRHGHANEIYISFGLDGEKLIIIIEDNGEGCKYIHEGFGLHHMRERVELLEGTLRFYGNQGFMIICELPIRKEKNYD